MFFGFWVVLGIFGAVLMTAKNKLFPVKNKALPKPLLFAIRVVEVVVGGGAYLLLAIIEWYFGPSWET